MMRAIIIFAFILPSMLSFASKIAIEGTPVYLYESNGTYFVPNTYVPGVDYNYVTLQDGKKVCYLNPQAQLNALNKMIITVNIRGLQNQWTCYDFDNTYFTVTP